MERGRMALKNLTELSRPLTSSCNLARDPLKIVTGKHVHRIESWAHSRRPPSPDLFKAYTARVFRISVPVVLTRKLATSYTPASAASGSEWILLC